MTRRLFAFGGLALAAALLFLSLPAMAQDIVPGLGDAVVSLLGPYAVPVGFVVLAAKAICALTPTPAPDSPWAKVYKGIEWAALIFGRMKHAIVVMLVPVGLLALAACSTDQTDKARAVGADVVAGVEVACAAYAPIAAELVNSNSGVVRSILVYGASVCDGSGRPIPGVALDDGTAVWVGQLAGMLKALASPSGSA